MLLKSNLFRGVDIVISALGGWSLTTFHNNVYEVCKATHMKRIVPAQFGLPVETHEKKVTVELKRFTSHGIKK
jgi:hypothetical protein